MPSAVRYTPRPFVPDRYEPRSRLGDYARAQGQDVAEAMRRQGLISANMWSGIGQGIAGTLRELAAYPQQQQQAAMLAQKQQREEQAYQEKEAAKQADAQKAQRLQQLVKEHQGQRVPTPLLIQEFGPQDAAEIDKAFDELFPAPKPPGTREVKTRNLDGSESIQIVPDTPGQSFESAPAPQTPKLHPVTVPGPNGRPMSKMFTEEELQAGVPVYREPKDAKPDTEPLVAIMGPDGSPILVRRSEAEGKRPASNREQGRPVTSGDAGELSEFTTALDDIQAVRTALSGNKATGTAAKAGAMLWNPITELTGVGMEAKQKQATIDRVKQVIGKALEGGVLRKEDELKYKAILPTIGDPPELVASKLDGLEKAIQKRIQRKIEALTDAGYDTSKFGEPKSKGATVAPDATSFRVGPYTVRVKP